MLSNSWIISRKSDGKAVFETYDRRIADRINTDAYTVETAHAYLCRYNQRVKEVGGVEP